VFIFTKNQTGEIHAHVSSEDKAQLKASGPAPGPAAQHNTRKAGVCHHRLENSALCFSWPPLCPIS